MTMNGFREIDNGVGTMRFGRGRGGPAALVALAALGLAACGGGQEAPTPEEAAEARTVELTERDVAEATLGSAGAGVTVTGSLEPYRVAEVRAQVPGTAAQVVVDAGDPVAAGAVLARIEAEGIRSQAAGAEAGVAAAEAGLALARRELDSAKRLYEAGAISSLEYDQAQAGFAAAEAQLAAARAQAAGAVESASRMVVRAPFDGEVSARMVELGEAVAAGQPLFRVVSTRFLELLGQVGVEVAGSIRVGMPVEFAITGHGETLRGEVSRIEPTADPGTRQVGVYVRLPNPDRALFGGQFARGRILSGEARDVVLIPEAALRGTLDAAYVWVVSDGRLTRRDVTAGPRDPAVDAVAIESGLEAGETVLLAPGEFQDGTPVRMRGGA